MEVEPDRKARLIALLRAINVGGHTVKMDRLRSLIEALGFSRVETFIASGNVIFDAPGADAKALESQIASHLEEALGYGVATFIRSAHELAEIARYRPFAESELDADGNVLYVAFVSRSPSGDAQRDLMTFRSDVDDFYVHGREIYWLCRKKMSDSAFSGVLLEKTIGMPATLRNSTTVRKLAAKYAPVV